jgi:glycosyltransferase involved in cell wall biosynthesis
MLPSEVIEPALMTARAAPRATMEVHFKLFGTDGVSLQSQELTKALSKRDWRVHPCSSDVPPQAGGLMLPELSYQSPDAVALRKRIFSPAAERSDALPAPATDVLVEEITARAEPIRQQVEQYVNAQQILLVHIRNVMSLPYNLPATLAFYRLAVDRPDIGFLMQHHDFYWEGPNARSFHTTDAGVTALMDRIMCPLLPNARHVLINPIAAEALRAKRGIEGTVIPDGFDFDRDVQIIDEAAFRGRLEILVGDSRPVGADDLVVAMPARVAINKAIELAIQFVAGLERKRPALEDAGEGIGLKRRKFSADSRIVLLLPQGEDLDENRDYFERLQAYARHSRITLAYGGNIVVPDRKFQRGDTDHYPFYSTYQAVDLVCYPPEHEGFGNQAIEAVWAKRPLAVLEYPVFKRFVRDHLPHYVSLGNTEQLARMEEFGGLHMLRPSILDEAVNAAIAVLKDHDVETRWTEENFKALRAFCGIETVAAEYIRLYGEMTQAAREVGV